MSLLVPDHPHVILRIVMEEKICHIELHSIIILLHHISIALCSIKSCEIALHRHMGNSYRIALVALCICLMYWIVANVLPHPEGALMVSGPVTSYSISVSLNQSAIPC